MTEWTHALSGWYTLQSLSAVPRCGRPSVIHQLGSQHEYPHTCTCLDCVEKIIEQWSVKPQVGHRPVAVRPFFSVWITHLHTNRIVNISNDRRIIPYRHARVPRSTFAAILAVARGARGRSALAVARGARRGLAAFEFNGSF